MCLYSSFVRRTATALICLCGATSFLYAQSGSPSVAGENAASEAVLSPLANGIAVQSRDLHEEICALRDDVLRIRIARGNALPEDASWAVLNEARHSSVAVTPTQSGDHFGFRTRSLIVELDKHTLELTIRNMKGEILQKDARPIRFDDNAFRIYKTMPLDEHYFGQIGRASCRERVWR